MADEPPVTGLTTNFSTASAQSEIYNTVKLSKKYRELQFMLLLYNTLMTDLQDLGKSRKSIYHNNIDTSFEDTSIEENKSQKAAVEIQKAEIMHQLTKIREFVYINGGCPDDDLLPLMPETQRKDRRESIQSLSSPSVKALSHYPPPTPTFGPFTSSMRNIQCDTDNKSEHMCIKRPIFVQTTSVQIDLHHVAHIQSHHINNKLRTDTPVPRTYKTRVSTRTVITFPQQHLTTVQSNKDITPSKTSVHKGVLLQTITPPSRSASTSISIPNSTTNEELGDGVDIKLDELQEGNDDDDEDAEGNESDDIDTDTDTDIDEDPLDAIQPLEFQHKHMGKSDSMSLRAKLWSVLLDCYLEDDGHIEYRKQIKKGHSIDYNSKILRDAQRTFLTSSEFNSRVSELQIIRILNAFVHKNNRAYTQGMDAIAGSLLFVMNESDAFQLLNVLMSIHFPLYFRSDPNDHSTSLIGAYAGTYLAYDILKIYDIELFNHLSSIHPYQYIFPLIASFQAISQPLSEMQKLWDYLFAYGVYLNPVVAISQLIVNRKKILKKSVSTLLMGLLSQRTWMNSKLKAKNVIKMASMIANKISSNKEYDALWQYIQLHSSDFDTANEIKVQYDAQIGGGNRNDNIDSDSQESSDWNDSSDSSDSSSSDDDSDID